MKKFLSLVLALTMALSLVTVSAGATDFEDDSDITYQEAVTVIQGMGIVDGYSDGSFKPDEVLTRGAAAKIICNLILGPTTADALSASSAPFVDVPTTNTFAGYITYCAQQGIISGYADGTFRPTDTLSGNAFMKMLLGALGYDSDKEGYTGANWTVNVIKQAVGIELNDGNDNFVGSQAVTREEACLYAFNTLQATMVEYSDSSTVTVGDITITSQGDYSDVTNSTSSDGNIENDGLMQFAERYFRDLAAEDDTDDFGRPSTNWVYDGDDLGTYANDADATCVVDDASLSLYKIATDNDYLDYSDSDILDDAMVYFNGQEVDGNSTYEDNENNTALAGKGDVVEAFENDDGDVEAIVIRSYTYAMIDEVDEDLSSSVQSDGASVGLELVDIDGDSLGNGTYYDDHDDDEKVLNGWSSDYDAGTAIAVALGEDDAILDSYVMETVTGTPTSARAVVTYEDYDFAKSDYYGEDAVKTGNITVDGTRYTYAAQFTGLEAGADVDFDEEYTVYLTNEGYALAVDGDATISLDDVYYVVGVYTETSRGSTSAYAQAISLEDGTVYEYRIDDEYTESQNNDELLDPVTSSGELKSNAYEEIHAFYEFDKDGSSYDVEKYEGSSRYSVVEHATLSADVTSSSSVIRISNDGYTDSDEEFKEGTDYYKDDLKTTRLYLTDSTFFAGAESVGDELDVTTATGVMTADEGDNVQVAAIYDDDDAAFVVYAADELSGATDKSDIVYLAGDANTRSNSDTYSGDLYFMDDMSLSEGVDISDEGETDQGFYVYELSDDVYELETEDRNMLSSSDFATDDAFDDADGYAQYVVFNYGRNSTVTSVTKGDDYTAAKDEAGDAYADGEFDAVSISGAKVIDTRDSDDADDDAYSNDINSPARLISALDKGWVVADVYVEDGDIIFVAVRACEDSDSADGSDSGEITVDEDSLTVSVGGEVKSSAFITNGEIDEVQSNNINVATVDYDLDDDKVTFTVYGVSAGTATLTIYGTDDNDETVRETVKVTVSAGAVEITLSDSSIELEKGGTDKVSASLSDGMITDVSSSNEDIATVAVKGDYSSLAVITVTADSDTAGEATITVEGVTSSGKFVEAIFTVTVLNDSTTLDKDNVSAEPGDDNTGLTSGELTVSVSGGNITVEYPSTETPDVNDTIIVTATGTNDDGSENSGSIEATFNDSDWNTQTGTITVTAENGDEKEISSVTIQKGA